MKIYLEHRGLFSNIHRLGKCRKLIGAEQTVHLHLLSQIRVTPIELYLLAFRFSWLKNMTLEISAAKLTRALVALFNKKPLLTLLVRVHGPLTAPQWKRISKISGRIVISDSTDSAENEALYQASRNVVYQNSRHDGISVFNSYAACTGMPMIGCEHTSCLGKTLYIARDGMVSYCPRFPEKTAVGKLGRVTSPFYDPGFLQILEKTLEKRESCKQTCPMFPICQAGCPLSFDCEQFQTQCLDARNDLMGMIEARTELSSLPLYKECAILYTLFGATAKNDTFRHPV